MKRIPSDILEAIERGFHDVIRRRAAEMNITHRIALPELSEVPIPEAEKKWSAVDGMYGGFSFWFSEGGAEAVLVCESWSRVVGGSGQRHEITAKGIKLVEEGFV